MPHWIARLGLVFLAGIGGALRASHLPVRVYTTADGLAANRISHIVRDSRGFLWFCTREGLSRFDGYEFTNFGVEQGLPTPVNFLLETRSGEYWIATEGGVARWNAAGSQPIFTVYRPEDPRAMRINVLAEDAKGEIWCGTDEGLYHLEQTASGWRMRLVDIGIIRSNNDDPIIEAILLDRSGTLWAGGPSGLYHRFANGRSERYTNRNGLPDTHVLALILDRKGYLWAGTWEGLCRLAISGVSSAVVKRTYNQKSGLPGHVVTALLEASDGKFWIGTDNGLSKYSSQEGRENFENVTSANGLSENGITSLGEDRAGNIWVGSTGANKISRGGFTGYTTRDGLASDCINWVVEERKGNLCVLTKASSREHVSQIYLNRFDGKRFHPVLPNIPQSIKYWGWGHHPFQDTRGKWWVPTGRGLFRFSALSDPADLRRAQPDAVYGPWNGLDGEDIFRLFEDSRGDIWIATVSATTNGLNRWERATGILHRYSSTGGWSPRLWVTAFAEDRAGVIWLGNEGAVARYREGHFEFFKTSEGVFSGGVRSLYVDDEGRLWVGCDGSLVLINSPTAATPKLIRYTTAQGLSSNDVLGITEDRWGRMYVSTGRGIDCFYPQLPLRVRHYSAADGLITGRLMAFRDRHGSLWFGGEAGLSRLDPEAPRPGVAPPVFINAVRVRGVPQALPIKGGEEAAPLELAPDQNQMEIQFVGLGFDTGEIPRYQYRLEGADGDWSAPTGQRQINYAALAPGSYRFLVRALGTDGLASRTPAIVSFTIRAPVWQHWWFRMLLVLLVGTIVYAAYRYRLESLLQVERLRTRIATDLHDDIGSTLSQIAILSEVASRNAREQEQVEPLSEIAHLSRESVDSISDIVWAIDPERDCLQDLSHRMRRFANDLFGSNGVQVSFRAPGAGQDAELGAEVRRQIFLMFKESLHNTAQHSGCTQVEIDFGVDRGWVVLSVQDNGRGFDARQIAKGHGLASIYGRAEKLGGRAVVESETGWGTRIRLWVPLDRRHA